MKKIFLATFMMCVLSSLAWADESTKTSIAEYLEKHVAGELRSSPNTYKAITNVFAKLPKDVLSEVTDYKRPVVFIGSYTTSIARFAKSHQFLVRPDDPPDTLSDGIYMIVLADELEKNDSAAIEGIVAHELAHRYLEHLLKPTTDCEMEREANRLVKEWEFEAEFLKAKKLFGAKKYGDSRCQDEEETVK